MNAQRPGLDLNRIDTALDEVRANVDHGEAPHNPYALQALRAAEELRAALGPAYDVIRQNAISLAAVNRRLRDTVVGDPLSTAGDRPDAVKGPWRAVLADENGFVTTLGDLDPSDVVSIRIVRDRDMPVRQVDFERLPGSRETGQLDTLYELDDLIVGDDDVAGRWAQAQTVAALLNTRNGINDLPGTKLPEHVDG
jgi:hypothetical protein